MKVYVGAAAVMVVTCSTVVDAQSLKDKEYFASEEKYLAEEVSFTNQRCDINLVAKFDWSTPPKPEERTANSAHGYCKEVLEGVRRVCDSSQAGKDAVKEKIKNLTCGFGHQRSIALKNGGIDFKISFGSANNADFVFEYLQNNL